MKSIRRILALLLCLVLCAALLPGQTPVRAVTGGVPTVSLSTGVSEPDGEATIEVALSDNPGLMAMRFEIVYDEKALELPEKITDENTGEETDPALEDGVLTDWSRNENRILWDGDADVADEGIILRLHFHVLETAAPGDHPVTLRCESGDLGNHAEESFLPEITPGSVHLHDWSEVSYDWAEDGGSVTASRSCALDESHGESEQGAVTAEETKKPGCEEAGEKLCTATFADPAFKTQTKKVPIQATGHDWELTGWTWTGHTAATANFTCRNDSTHTASAPAEITSAATEEKYTHTAAVAFAGREYTDTREELRRYTVRFLNEDGTELQSGEIAYGEMPVYTGAAPVKENTDDHTYVFEGWTPMLAKVTGPAEYTAVFSERSEGRADRADTFRTIVPDGIRHGKVTVSPNPNPAGEKTVVTLIPDRGYTGVSLSVFDRNGRPVKLERNGDGTWSFRMPEGGASIDALFEESYLHCEGAPDCPLHGFSDLAPDAWYHNGVHFTLAHGIMEGVGGGRFDPSGSCSRAMLVTVLWRADGQPAAEAGLSFLDVPNGKWYTDAVRWAASAGIVYGYDKESFGPEDPVTREQLAAILCRYAQYKGYPMELPPADALDGFADSGDVSPWAREALGWTTQNGIILGMTEDALSPGSHATRAQIATMLMRFCGLFEDAAALPPR